MGLFLRVYCPHTISTKMAEEEDWSATATEEVAPVETVVAETPEIKLFGRWTTSDVQINDISLTDYLPVKDKYSKYLPHSSGRYQVKRLVNSMMMHGRNNGKKLLTVRIVKHAFEIIH